MNQTSAQPVVQVGDLVKTDAGQALVLSIPHPGEAWVIQQHGICWRCSTRPHQHGFTPIRSTRLIYRFSSKQQARHDYETGLFTPYFISAI